MTKRSKAAEEQREAELGRYELPGFAAGMAVDHLETILKLLDGQCASHGHTAFIDIAVREAYEAIGEAKRWQKLAAEVTKYPFARERER